MFMFFRMERPTIATRASVRDRPPRTACWIRWMFEANEATTIRPVRNGILHDAYRAGGSGLGSRSPGDGRRPGGTNGIGRRSHAETEARAGRSSSYGSRARKRCNREAEARAGAHRRRPAGARRNARRRPRAARLRGHGDHRREGGDRRDRARRIRRLLLTDLRMPGADSKGLLRRSQAAAPEAPVIIMTAFSEVELRRGDRVNPPRRVPLPHEALQGRRARAVPSARARRRWDASARVGRAPARAPDHASRSRT